MVWEEEIVISYIITFSAGACFGVILMCILQLDKR